MRQLQLSRPCDGYGHHRWRHRDQSSSQVEDDYHSLCSRCPPGFGVARPCNQVEDTVCHSCPEGYYAASYSRKHPCWPCSRCGKKIYISFSSPSFFELDIIIIAFPYYFLLLFMMMTAVYFSFSNFTFRVPYSSIAPVPATTDRPLSMKLLLLLLLLLLLSHA
jgi:hypothetical protein